MIQQNTLIMKNQNDLGGHDQQQQQEDEEEEQPLNSLYLNRPTRGAGCYYNPNQKTITTQSISNFNSDIDLKKKETAVAALSATLAFQRFDNNNNNNGGLLSNNNLDDSVKSRESVNDTIKKIQDGTSNITNITSNTNNRISPMKGATDMNTIFMNMNKRRISNSKRADNDALRRSLQGTLGLSPGASSSSINAGYTVSSFRRSLQETQSGSRLNLDVSDDNDKDDDDDDDSKDFSGDIIKLSEMEEREIEEKDMTQDKRDLAGKVGKYSHLVGTTASDNGSENNDIVNGEDGDDKEASSKSLDFEASDELQQIEMDAMKHLSEHSIVPPDSVDSSAREFMSSLQKLYKPNLQDSDKPQDIPTTSKVGSKPQDKSTPQDVQEPVVPKDVHTLSVSRGKPIQPPPTSSNNVNKPTTTSEQNKLEGSATSFSNHNDSQAWSSKIYNLKKKESTSNENMTAPSTQPSFDNLSEGQTWNNMLKRTSNRQKNNGRGGRISSSNSLSRNRKKLSFNSRGSSGSLSGHRARLSFQNLRERIQRSSTASIPSQQSKGNGGGYNKNSEWKESASPLSSCLKHDDASSTISPSLRQAGRQGRRSSTRSCVSWQIDDTNLDEELHSQAPRISWNLNDSKLDELLPEQFAPSTITANNSNTVRRFSSVSHGAASIDEDQLERKECPPHNPRARRASLEADEELLSSMLRLAKHMGESHSPSSTWGNHVSISSLEQSTEISAGQEDNEKKPSIQQDETLATPPATSSLETSEGQATAEDAAVSTQDGTTTNKRQDQQDELGGLVRSATTAAAVTRLVYQEVEDYRTRLQRKRASMEDMYSKCNSADEATSNAASSASSREDELNELLQENAMNISNALLLQRALYTLGIHNSESNRNLVRGASGGESSIQESTISSSASMPRAHSEHTGINRMAINHLLTLSGTTPKKSAPPVTNPSTTSGSNAQWGTSVPPFNSSNTSNPSTTSQRRRFTYQEGPEPSVPDEAAFQAQRRASQVGAYQSNEPAPLLFRRTFNASAPNRRATRDEARRNTLQALAMENAAEAASATTTRNHSCPATMFDSDVHTFDCGSSAGSYSRSDSLNSNDQRHTHHILEEIDETSSVSSTHLRSDSLNSHEMERQRTVIASNLTTTSSSVPSSEAESYDYTFCPVNIAPAPPGRSRVGSNISSSTNTNRSSMFSSTNTRGSIRFADLEERPDQSPATATRPRGGSVGSDIEATNNESLRSYLMASVRRQSYNSKKMLQAILVSDEIVEADHIETTYHEDSSTDGMHGDIEMGESQASMQARLVMMEELLEENEEEQELILERYEKRERIMKGLVSVSVVVIIALVVVIIVSSI